MFHINVKRNRLAKFVLIRLSQKFPELQYIYELKWLIIKIANAVRSVDVIASRDFCSQFFTQII